MCQSGPNLMSEEPTYLSSNISTVKKPSFEVKKRSSPLEEHGDIRKPLKLVKTLTSDSQIKKMSFTGTRDTDYKAIFCNTSTGDSPPFRNERVKTLDSVVVKKNNTGSVDSS